MNKAELLKKFLVSAFAFYLTFFSSLSAMAFDSSNVVGPQGEIGPVGQVGVVGAGVGCGAVTAHDGQGIDGNRRHLHDLVVVLDELPAEGPEVAEDVLVDDAHEAVQLEE